VHDTFADTFVDVTSAINLVVAFPNYPDPDSYSHPDTFADSLMNLANRAELATLFTGEGVELGVAAGHYSEVILKHSKCRRLWSIDRWADHHNAAEYKEAATRLAKAGRGRCVPLRMLFEDALALFPNESLDFIYIDGYAHTGQNNGKTLDDWWPKLKPAGIFAGHDYHDKYPKTVEAVEQFIVGRGVHLNVTGIAVEGEDLVGLDKFPSWWFRKPGVEDIPSPPLKIMTGSPVHPEDSIILVGNGPSALLRGKQGSTVDRFNQVVRFNTYAISGYEEFVGTKTTLWSTFGRGYRPKESTEKPKRAVYIHGDKPKTFPFPIDEVWGIPRSYFDDVMDRVKKRSRRENTNAKLLPSSGLVVALWLLEVCGAQQLTLFGFDHFAKKESTGHHYWIQRSFLLPPEHDGEAEAEIFSELLQAGKITYLK
jgi:hypothetical protein